MGNKQTSSQPIVKSYSSDSISVEDLETKQPAEPEHATSEVDKVEIDKSIVSDLYNKLNHFESELQKSNHTVLLLNQTIESLTNQVNILSENITQTYKNANESLSTSTSIQNQLYALERTFTISATSFDNGIKKMNYIVHSLIQNESVLVKNIDKLVSIVNIYEKHNKQRGEETDDDDEAEEEEEYEEDEQEYEEEDD